MKTRIGFVSNSSASSFVLLTTVENHERALAASPAYVRAVAEALFLRDGQRVQFMGKDCIGLVLIRGEGNPLLGDLQVDFKGRRMPSLWGDGDMDPEEALEAYRQELEKGDCFVSRLKSETS